MKTLQKPEGSWNQREGGGYTSRSRSGLCLCDTVCCSLECIGIASGISEQWREFNPVTHVLKSVHSPGKRVLTQSSRGICINTPVFACWFVLLFYFLYLAYLPPTPDETYFSSLRVLWLLQRRVVSALNDLNGRSQRPESLWEVGSWGFLMKGL